MNGRFGGRVSMASESGSGEIDAPTASSGGPRPARVFVALKMTPEIAGELAQMARELERFPVRLIAPADIHLTLVPPWNEVSIPDAVGKLGRVGRQVRRFYLGIPACRIRSGAETPASSVGGMRGGTGPDTTARRASSHLRANGRAAVSAARHAGPASRQRSRHRAEMSGRSGSCAHATRRLGRTHAIARSRRTRLQGSCVAAVRRKSGISIAHARLLGAAVCAAAGSMRRRWARFHPPPFPRVRRQAQEPAASRQSPRPPDP